MTGKGFGVRQSKHRVLTLYYEEKKTSVSTIISHNQQDYSDSLLGQMARQFSLSKEELKDLIDCPLSYDELIRLLIERKRITP